MGSIGLGFVKISSVCLEVSSALTASNGISLRRPLASFRTSGVRKLEYGLVQIILLSWVSFLFYSDFQIIDNFSVLTIGSEVQRNCLQTNYCSLAPFWSCLWPVTSSSVSNFFGPCWISDHWILHLVSSVLQWWVSELYVQFPWRWLQLRSSGSECLLFLK